MRHVEYLFNQLWELFCFVFRHLCHHMTARKVRLFILLWLSSSIMRVSVGKGLRAWARAYHINAGKLFLWPNVLYRGGKSPSHFNWCLWCKTLPHICCRRMLVCTGFHQFKQDWNVHPGNCLHKAQRRLVSLFEGASGIEAHGWKYLALAGKAYGRLNTLKPNFLTLTVYHVQSPLSHVILGLEICACFNELHCEVTDMKPNRSGKAWVLRERKIQQEEKWRRFSHFHTWWTVQCSLILGHQGTT